ncbi:MAG: nucleotidyltransferase family protein [bacterium]|nr:nucleotidyltransferase family protein [bacterium]
MTNDPLITAAELSSPWVTATLPELQGPAHETVAKILRRNHVSFLAMEKKFGLALRESAWREALQAERNEFDVHRAEFERIRRDFESNGIRTMLFKSTGLYPSFPHMSSNLDVLVEQGKANLGRRRLWALGYVELVNVEEPLKFLFRKFSGDGTRFTFHLHEAVGWGVPFLDVDDVWKGARIAADDPVVTIPGVEEALLVTLSHWFYEDKALTLQNLFLTAHALRNLPDGGFASAARHAERCGWVDGFYGALHVFDRSWRLCFGEDGLDEAARADVDAGVCRCGVAMRSLLRRTEYRENYLATEPFLLNKVVYYQKVFADSRRPFARQLADLWKTLLWAVRWKLHVRSQPGHLITISGCDGSGKTVQTERLEEVVRVCDLRVKILWARGASSGVMGALIRFAKAVTGRGGAGEPVSANEEQKMENRREAARNPVLRWLFAFFFSLDLGWVYILKARWYLATGHVLICDRYLIDAFVDFGLYTGIDPSAAPLPLRILDALSPLPRAAFLLDVEPDEALRRKPEEGGTAHLDAARRMLLVEAAGRGVQVIPATAGVDETHEEIARVSLKAFLERYRTLGNWLLASNPEQLNPGVWRMRRDGTP